MNFDGAIGRCWERSRGGGKRMRRDVFGLIQVL
jgi:hypothetical protein